MPPKLKTADGVWRPPIGLQPKQQRLLELVENSPATWIGYGGSRGGSKSDAARKVMLYRRLRYKNTRGLIFRRTYDDLWENHITKFFSTWPETRSMYSNEHHEMTLPGGSVIKFDYAQHKIDIDHFQGKEFMDIIPDEATHLQQSELEAMKACNRWPGVPESGCKMILPCNPGNVGHAFIKRVMITREYHENENPEDYAFLQAYGWDNVEWSRDSLVKDGIPIGDYYRRWTDEERFNYFIERTSYGRTLNSLPYSLRIGWLLGHWDKFAGQYFTNFDRAKHVTPVREIEGFKHWSPRWISIDWGLDHPSAVYWHATIHEGLHVTYREFLERNLTPPQLAAEIAKRCVHPDGSPETIKAIYLSPDAKARRDSPDTIKKQLNREFLSFGLPEASDADAERVGGWMLMYQMLDAGSWLIDPSCKRLIECLPSLKRDEEKDGDIVKVNADADGLGGDDPADSARYGLKSRLQPGQAPLEDRVLARVHAAQPKNETHRQMLTHRIFHEEREKTAGIPWAQKMPSRGRRP